MSSIIAKEPVLVKILNGNVISQSDVLAKEFNKPHKDILKKIRSQIKMIEESSELIGEELRRSIHEYFIVSDRVDNKNRTYDRYSLTFEGFQLVALSMTGKEAFAHKRRFIKQYKDLLRIVVENKLTAKLNKTDGAWGEIREGGKVARKELTAAIQDYELPQRKKEGKGDMNFVSTRIMNYTTLIKKTLNFDIPKGTEPRDVLSAKDLIKLELMEEKVARMIVGSDRHYKQTYQWVKETLQNDMAIR